MNKTDVKDADFAKEWMTDFEAFQAALRQEEEAGSFGGVEGSSTGIGGGSGYMGSLLNSMSLMLEEFYSHMSMVGVSAMTGAGIDAFFEAVTEKAQEFDRDYKPELERRRKQRENQVEDNRQKELGKLMKDMAMSGEGSSKVSKTAPAPNDDMDTISDFDEEDDEEQDEDDGDDEGGDGLQQRYKQALDASGAPDPEDHSFARYMRASQMGM